MRAGDRPRPSPGRPTGPCIMVIFGVTGDLTERKLMAALYNLDAARLLPEEFAVVGIASSEYTSDAFRRHLQERMIELGEQPFDLPLLENLLARVHYVQGRFEDPDTYSRLAAELAQVDEDHGTGGSWLFYLATPPTAFLPIVRQLSAHHLTTEQPDRWRRVVIEKPFGRDGASARLLDSELQKLLREDQVYRIDHYLGKETVQNILVFRFGNGIFEPIWNRRYIDHVQITVAETLGVGHRGRYYEEAGALRDMVPNHLFQLLALTASEPPTSFEAEAVRDERGKAMRAIQPLNREEVLSCVVRGQYGEGVMGNGEQAPAYRAEPGVPDESVTETYVALKLMIDNWRWADVPFYLRTGKRLAADVSEIAVQFKRAPLMLFRDTPIEYLTPNLLVIRMHPDEGISLRFEAKIPGFELRIGSVEMDFGYSDYFKVAPSTGYETLLYDCMRGDPTLFQRADSVEAGWSVVDPILEVWAERPPADFPNYSAGSWGPAGAHEVPGRDGFRWRTVE